MQNINNKFKKLPQYDELVELTKNMVNNEVIRAQTGKHIQSEDFRFGFLVENQRGMKMFGITFYSDTSLLPIIDPLRCQKLDGSNILLSDGNMKNFVLPDLDWKWAWDDWYVLMSEDNDEEGWIYSGVFFSGGPWKGRYKFGNFVRRRIWIRLMYQMDSNQKINGYQNNKIIT